MNKPVADINAESQVLGALLYDDRLLDAIPARLTPASFAAAGSHGVIFEAILELRAEGAAVNAVTVASLLRDKVDDKKNPRIMQLRGGAQMLNDLVNGTAVLTPKTFDFLAQSIVNKATQRKLQIVLARAVARASDTDLDINLELGQLEREILDLSLTVDDGGGLVHVADALRDEVKEWIRRSKEKVAPGISTGFANLDRETGGLHGGELIVLGARPGMGKTSLVTSFAVNVARSPNVVVDIEGGRKEILEPATAIFSLEMPRGQLAGRMLCTESGLSISRVRQGRFEGDDLTRATHALSELRELGVYIDDATRGRPTVTEIVARSRRLAAALRRKKKRLALIVVDYIQIVKLDENIRKQRHDLAVGDVSLELKSLAKELNTTVVACAQLNRSVESRPDKRPGMADVRDSGQIEQDADQILMLYRDEYYDPNTTARGVVEVIIEKNRHGDPCTVKLRFDGPTTSFAYDPQLDVEERRR